MYNLISGAQLLQLNDNKRWRRQHLIPRDSFQTFLSSLCLGSQFQKLFSCLFPKIQSSSFCTHHPHKNIKLEGNIENVRMAITSHYMFSSKLYNSKTPWKSVQTLKTNIQIHSSDNHWRWNLNIAMGFQPADIFATMHKVQCELVSIYA